MGSHHADDRGDPRTYGPRVIWHTRSDLARNVRLTCNDADMNFDLGPVLVALVALFGAVVGSAATIAAAISPTTRRVRRLEQLIEVRKGVEDAATIQRIDYSTRQLSQQIGEAARLNGDRYYPSFRRSSVVLLAVLALGGVAALAPFLDSQYWVLALVIVGLILGAISASLTVLEHKMRQSILHGVDRELAQLGHHQRGEPAGPEGLTEGDVPSA